MGAAGRDFHNLNVGFRNKSVGSIGMGERACPDPGIGVSCVVLGRRRPGVGGARTPGRDR
jgi:hypothetical protein